jgi:hypothetical protein
MGVKSQSFKAYPLSPNNQAPFIEPSSNAFEIERTYGIWKMRFRCLNTGLTVTPKRSLDVTVAPAGLHNVCMKKNPFEYDETEEDEEDLQLPQGQIDSDEGRRLRDQLVQNVFAFQ